MFYLLMDTCSWIDQLAEEKRANLNVLEYLVSVGEITLLKTSEVVDELLVDPKKQARIFKERNEQIHLHLNCFMPLLAPDQQDFLGRIIADLRRNERVIWAERATSRVFKLLEEGFEIPDSDAVSLRVMHRRQEGLAPFRNGKGVNRNRNMNDALVFEKFAQQAACRRSNDRYAFVSNDGDEFLDKGKGRDAIPGEADPSMPVAERRKHEPIPHRDIAGCFDDDNVVFHRKLDPVLRRFFPGHMKRSPKGRHDYAKRRSSADVRIQLAEVAKEERYEHILKRRMAIGDGRLRLVPDGPRSSRMRPSDVSWASWCDEASEVRRFEGSYDGPIPARNEFNAGVIAGQAAALRWVLGLGSNAWPTFKDQRDDGRLLPFPRQA